MRKFFATVALMALLSVSNAQAGIITYIGSNELSVEFTSITSNILVTAQDTTFSPPTLMGNGAGTQGFNVFGDANNLLVGDVVTSYSTVSGFAPVDSLSNTFGGGLITFTNTSMTAGDFSFLASWRLSAETSLGPYGPADDGLSQGYTFLLDQNGNDILNGGSAVFLQSLTAFGGGPLTDVGSNAFNFSLNPGEVFTLDVGSSSYGQAFSTAAVPESSSFVLMSLGGISMFLLRRRLRLNFG